jgi:signal peptidase I
LRLDALEAYIICLFVYILSEFVELRNCIFPMFKVKGSSEPGS